MLTDIHIQHFTIIDELELSLYNGMTVITGETGAGKSIIIDAVELALGERASNHVISPSAEKAEIHLHFNIEKIPAAKAWLDAHDITYADNECLIRRVIHRDGRSKSFVNQIPVTLPLLREFSACLINIHGQHEFQHLLKADYQRELLDQYAQHDQLIDDVKTIFNSWQETQEKYNHLLKQQDSSLQRADYLRFQLEELNVLNLTVDELNELEQEQKQLANVENLLKQTNQALSILQENDFSVITQLNQTLQALDSIQHLNPQLQNTYQILNQALVNSEEGANELRHYLNHLENDPDRLTFVEERLSKAHDLARKHRINLEELPALQNTMQQELNSLSNLDEHLAALQNQITQLKNNYFIAAEKLHKSRAKEAKKLSEKITKNIQQLSMPNGKLEIVLTPFEDEIPRAQGMEKIQFLVSANPGQPLQTLQTVASGGELSRISLAIQVITAQQNFTPTLIFDEVDVGIGGATADVVGKLLRELGEKTQVFCITHLAQVAAKGHHHIKVEKQQQKEMTKTQIIILDKTERIQEIARMAGGVEINQQTLAHAEALLSTI